MNIEELLLFAVDNSNEYFLKYAFRDPDPIFPEEMLIKRDIIEQLLSRLSNCNDIEMILNILLRA